jgi:hypothetical protein
LPFYRKGSNRYLRNRNRATFDLHFLHRHNE